jgi:tellurite resistance protein TehA-like permease
MIRKPWLEQLRDFYPGYFALIMATGIVSIGCHFLHLNFLARFLFYTNIAAYLIVWALTLFRTVRFPQTVWADFSSHAKGPAFLTVVAGTCILGSQFAILQQSKTIPWMLWILAIVLWTPMMYLFLAAVTVKEPKPELEIALSGSWLILVVATQSISVLGSIVVSQMPNGGDLLFVPLCMYLLGCMLYLPIISLIFYRWTFFKMSAIQLTPPYWINMGALAITTLAGTRLIQNASNSPLLMQLSPFISGFTLFFWATGTWWIPLLLLLGAWRHVYKRIPLKYDPQFWGMVFPLGMYTTATLMLGRTLAISSLERIADGFIYVALLAWFLTFIGMMKALLGAVLTSRALVKS